MKPVGKHFFEPSTNPRFSNTCKRCGRREQHPIHNVEPIPKAA